MQVASALKRRWPLVAAAALVALAVLGAVAYAYFLPQRVTEVAEEGPGGEVVRAGEFEGADALHRVSGTVALHRTPEGWVARFEDYDATSGPDVYFWFVTGTARDAASVESGLLVRVPGGAKDGQATLRGDFNVPLPADFDPEAWDAVVAWCDRFDVLFGEAPLS